MVRFILFGYIWYRLVALQNSVQNGLKCCKSLCHEVVSDLATNPSDPPHWTLTSYFGVFRTIWVHLGQFSCVTKLGAKWDKLVQKFVPWSHVGFRNERTRSTPLDPNLMIRCVCTIWVHLRQFGCVTKPSAKWAKLVQKFMPRSRVGIFLSECTRSTPLDSKLMFWSVLYNLDAFGTVWLPYKTQCKTGRTGAKVRTTKSHHNFSHRTHLIDPVGI